MAENINNLYPAGSNVNKDDLRKNLGNFTNVQGYGSPSDGSGDAAPGFVAAAADTPDSAIFVPSGTYQIDTDFTMVAGTVPLFSASARMRLANGTFTRFQGGMFSLSAQEIFVNETSPYESPGDITISAGRVSPSWWGITNATPIDATVSSGSVAFNASVLRLDTEAQVSVDDLDNITGGTTDGQRVFLVLRDPAREVVLKHGTGNLQLQEDTDFTLSDVRIGAVLEYNATDSNWHSTAYILNPAAIELDNTASDLGSAALRDVGTGVGNLVLFENFGEPAGDNYANQTQAEAGTRSDLVMSPLRTAQAIAALVGSGSDMTRAVFNSSGTWTVPSGITTAYIILIGGGGGGGGHQGTSGAGGGGGAGAYALAFITGITPGSNVSITVGSGGNGGGINGGGGNGGTSSYGSILSAGGGRGGTASTGAGGAAGSTTIGNADRVTLMSVDHVFNGANDSGDNGGRGGSLEPYGTGGNGATSGGGGSASGIGAGGGGGAVGSTVGGSGRLGQVYIIY